MRIFVPRLFDGEDFTGPATIEIVAGTITAIMDGAINPDLTLPHGVLGPGLIDLHNNGAFGVDCASATPEEWDRYVSSLAVCGVTSILPTFITAPPPDIERAASRLHTAMRRHPGLLGLHLEGPFLAPAKRGAHQQEWLRLPDKTALDEVLQGATKEVLRLITLAPDLPHALDAISYLTKTGIQVSLGHTNADATQTRAAVQAGARLVTHLFNTQSPLGHRAIGMPGVALTDPHLAPCVIVDGVHVAPELLQIIFAACPRAIAVTDSIALAGLTVGTALEFGGATATLSPEGVGKRADGTIAGAAITLDEGVRRLIRFGVPPQTAMAAATSRPAAAMGLATGYLKPGAPADIVWWSDDFHPLQVWQAGQTLAKAKPPTTETARPDLADLDIRSTIEIVAPFLAQEQNTLHALQMASPALCRLIDEVATRMQAGGRLFYAGAGTSGRLGLLDAVECRPTFGVEPGMIVPLLAGGTSAFIQAVEGAEDNEQDAVQALNEHGFGPLDSLIGIAASGKTPFTLAAVNHATALGGLTGAIVNNPDSKMARAAKIAVEILSGPEIIAGSTRLSAGTSEKIALNILSSAVMIRLGRTYGPFMVDMRASNAKLRRRAIQMVMALTNANEATALATLQACGMHVKLAILVLHTGLTPTAANAKLQACQGSLRRAMA